MLAAMVTAMIESVGDYYACARLSAAPNPPSPAISRGVLIEGIGCALAGMWGSGSGTASYAENIAAISITKVFTNGFIISINRFKLIGRILVFVFYFTDCESASGSISNNIYVLFWNFHQIWSIFCVHP